ncbi:general secretion pathway protein GspM [Seongchinamella unica]|uniref:General secretion pathway protein GspM n=1 Tax=Seongchinamella unica TaxID=2547392 RepID=A0A4R5LUP2_9GAMM|nr:type II secretion system protein GspM [Seongchinamella unica]TDG15119.1 general secretion pathway protein GspM [Seongchinamella unica]
MIAWAKAHPRSAAICGATLVLPVLLYLNVLFGAWGLRVEYAADVDRLGPKIARLKGIQQVEQQLRESSGLVQQQNARLVYPATAERTSVAAAMQSEVRQLLEDAGLTVSNSQVMPVREEEKFDYIGVKLTVAGDVASLDRALVQLAEFAPLVIVESLDIWPTRQRARQGEAAVQDATASLKLLSLRSVI